MCCPAPARPPYGRPRQGRRGAGAVSFRNSSGVPGRQRAASAEPISRPTNRFAEAYRGSVPELVTGARNIEDAVTHEEAERVRPREAVAGDEHGERIEPPVQPERSSRQARGHWIKHAKLRRDEVDELTEADGVGPREVVHSSGRAGRRAAP